MAGLGAFSRILRRTHMYVALFLTPWVLMYALSTMAMNHRDYFRKAYGGNPVLWEKEKEQTYPAAFPARAEPRAIGQQILADLGLDGLHNVNNAADGSLTIIRHDPVTPRRIRYRPDDGRLIVERQVFRAPAFLERLHRRRGYQSDHALEDGWAVSVDLVIVAMVFWVASGLWMWWELQTTRRWGALFGAAGLALFGFFLATI
jgi:hypothetical protein